MCKSQSFLFFFLLLLLGERVGGWMNRKCLFHTTQYWRRKRMLVTHITYCMFPPALSEINTLTPFSVSIHNYSIYLSTSLFVFMCICRCSLFCNIHCLLIQNKQTNKHSENNKNNNCRLTMQSAYVYTQISLYKRLCNCWYSTKQLECNRTYPK